MKPAGLELHIGELVLHGISPSDRHRIGESMQQELSRLFTERGVPEALSRGGALPALDGGSFQVSSTARPEQIGRQIAHSVYGGIEKLNQPTHRRG